MRSRRPPTAAQGKPPPITLPRTVRSGRMPKSSCAPPRPTRKPVMTSSKTSSAPLASHAARSSSRKPAAGGTTPMFAAIGSTTTQAISSPRAVERLAHRRPVVVRQDDRVGDGARRDAGRPGQPQGRHARPGGREQGVAVPVVAALELHDGRAAGRAAGEADGGHRRLGPGRDQADHLDGRHGRRRSVRPGAPRPRSARRTTSRGPRPRRRRGRSRAARVRTAAPPTTARSRAGGCRRRPRRRRPRRGR